MTLIFLCKPYKHGAMLAININENKLIFNKLLKAKKIYFSKY